MKLKLTTKSEKHSVCRISSVNNLVKHIENFNVILIMQLPDTNSEDSNLPTEKPDTDKPEKMIIIKEKSKQPLIGNIIIGIAVIFNGLMFYYKYQLFNETRHASAISNKVLMQQPMLLLNKKRWIVFQLNHNKNHLISIA